MLSRRLFMFIALALAAAPMSARAVSSVGGATPARAADQAAVFPECDLAVRWASRTFVPVTIQLLDPAKATFRQGAIRAALVYEDFSAVNMVGGDGPKRVAIEVHAVKPPRPPFDAAFQAKHDLAREKLAPAALARETGLTSAEVRGLADLARWRAKPKDGKPAYDVLEFHSPRFTYLYARKNDPSGELVAQIQFTSKRPIRSTIDLADPQYRYFRW